MVGLQQTWKQSTMPVPILSRVGKGHPVEGTSSDKGQGLKSVNRKRGDHSKRTEFEPKHRIKGCSKYHRFFLAPGI